MHGGQPEIVEWRKLEELVGKEASLVGFPLLKDTYTASEIMTLVTEHERPYLTELGTYIYEKFDTYDHALEAYHDGFRPYYDDDTACFLSLECYILVLECIFPEEPEYEEYFN